MKTVELHTFGEFEERAAGLMEAAKKRGAEPGVYVSPVLFRGQARASWDLETTLERYTPKSYSPGNYYKKVMLAVQPTIESCTERRWDLPSDYTREDKIPGAPQGYPFMAYLRHHGFPCPLLDWTRSAYVAAFFAFQSEEAKNGPVAIYSFVEYGGVGKSGRADEATIVSLGRYVRTHKRHFNQQSQSTYCQKLLNDKYVYCSHEHAFARNDSNQDILTKFVIPQTERAKVLDKLHTMNITAYSLFGSEESLLETLAYQEI